MKWGVGGGDRVWSFEGQSLGGGLLCVGREDVKKLGVWFWDTTGLGILRQWSLGICLCSGRASIGDRIFFM